MRALNQAPKDSEIGPFLVESTAHLSYFTCKLIPETTTMQSRTQNYSPVEYKKFFGAHYAYRLKLERSMGIDGLKLLLKGLGTEKLIEPLTQNIRQAKTN